MSFDPALRQISRALKFFVLSILLVSSVFIFRSFRNNDEATSSVTPQEDHGLTKLRFFQAQTLKDRQTAGEIFDFLDIRSYENYVTSHIVGSTWITLDTLSDTLPKTGTPIIVVDEAVPSTIIEQVASRLQTKNVSFALFADGMTAWQAVGGLVISLGDPNSYLDQSKVTYITPSQAKELLTSRLLVLDVQSSGEYSAFHLPRAINIPLPELEQRRSEIPLGQPILVYGKNALDSFQAGVRLFDLNFLGTRVMDGGVTSWKEKGFPVESSPSQ